MLEKNKVDYTLYYWPAPFRGHFIRAILTYANANWEEGENVAARMRAKTQDQQVPFMGPPMLVNNTNGFALSQMPAIAYYLGEKFNLLPETVEGKALALKVINDANDVIDELTLQGGMEMWTQESWQDFIPRLKRWMSFWEVLLERSRTPYLIGSVQPMISDIVTATLWMTVSERFPIIDEILEETAPKTRILSQKLWENELSQFARRSWETYGNSYCGGQIEQSMRKVIK